MSNISKKLLKEIANLKDSEIDTSDIPELDDDFWQNAKLVMPVKKKPIHIMIDEDILLFFKAQKQGKRGYQTEINAVLRTFVEAQQNRIKS